MISSLPVFWRTFIPYLSRKEFLGMTWLAEASCINTKYRQVDPRFLVDKRKESFSISSSEEMFCSLLSKEPEYSTDRWNIIWNMTKQRVKIHECISNPTKRGTVHSRAKKFSQDWKAKLFKR